MIGKAQTETHHPELRTQQYILECLENYNDDEDSFDTLFQTTYSHLRKFTSSASVLGVYIVESVDLQSDHDVNKSTKDNESLCLTPSTSNAPNTADDDSSTIDSQDEPMETDIVISEETNNNNHTHNYNVLTKPCMNR